MSTARLSAETWESLLRAQVTLMRRFERAGDFAPLRAREYDVLFQLSKEPGGALRLRELNERIMLTQPSLSRMIERLESKDLVRRDPAPDDARGLLVRLTPTGAELQRQVGRRHVRSIQRYVGGALDEQELRTLAELTARLYRAQPSLPD